MSKIGLSAAIGAVALLGLAGTSPAQHGGTPSRQSGRGGYSHENYQHGYGGEGGYGRGYYGGSGWGYYSPSFGLYIGPGPGYSYRYPYYGGYEFPSDWGYYYNPPSYSYVEPSHDYQSTYGYFEPSVPTPYPSSAGLAEDHDPNAALLEVMVPENAQLWFAGARTAQTGPVRHFVSPSLPPGQPFTYEIRARWTDASGRSVERIKRVKVQAGARIGVNFNS